MPRKKAKDHMEANRIRYMQDRLDNMETFKNNVCCAWDGITTGIIAVVSILYTILAFAVAKAQYMFCNGWAGWGYTGQHCSFGSVVGGAIILIIALVGINGLIWLFLNAIRAKKLW